MEWLLAAIAHACVTVALLYAVWQHQRAIEAHQLILETMIEEHLRSHKL